MSTIHRSRQLFCLPSSHCSPCRTHRRQRGRPFNADDEVIAAEEVLAPAPAVPSWDETSGYGSVEASRAAASALHAASRRTFMG